MGKKLTLHPDKGTLPKDTVGCLLCLSAGGNGSKNEHPGYLE